MDNGHTFKRYIDQLIKTNIKANNQSSSYQSSSELNGNDNAQPGRHSKIEDLITFQSHVPNQQLQQQLPAVIVQDDPEQQQPLTNNVPVEEDNQARVEEIYILRGIILCERQ